MNNLNNSVGLKIYALKRGVVSDTRHSVHYDTIFKIGGKIYLRTLLRIRNIVHMGQVK